jgi:hypothetical protein
MKQYKIIAHFSHIIKLYFCYLGASCTIVYQFIKIYFSFIIKETENPGLDTVLHVGDRVCVFLPAEELKEVQRGRGGWSMRMTEVIMS